jgi:hypothetical protein
MTAAERRLSILFHDAADLHLQLCELKKLRYRVRQAERLARSRRPRRIHAGPSQSKRLPHEPFDDPIPVPKGKPLLTLNDAADYITKLPETEQHHPAWQAAFEALILVAETNGSTMFARIGMMRALNLSKPAAKIAQRRKRAKAYTIVR